MGSIHFGEYGRVIWRRRRRRRALQTWLFLFSFFPRFPPFIVIICGGRLFSRAAVTLITPVPLASAPPIGRR